MPTLTVVSAGLRDPSSTRLLADQVAVAAARELAGGAESRPEVDVRHVEVRQHAHEIVDALLTGFPTGALKAALADVAEADALVFVTPTFQASYAGIFKSFMDLVEVDSVRGTPVVLAATGGSERHSLVLDHALRPLAAYLGMLAMPTGIYAATADFGGVGTSALTERINRAARELAAVTLPAQRSPGGANSEVGGSWGSSPGNELDATSQLVPFEQMLGAIRP